TPGGESAFTAPSAKGLTLRRRPPTHERNRTLPRARLRPDLGCGPALQAPRRRGRAGGGHAEPAPERLGPVPLQVVDDRLRPRILCLVPARGGALDGAVV